MTRYSTENIIHFRAVFHYHQCRKCIVTYSAPAFAEATDGQAGNDGKEKGLKPARIATQSVAGGGGEKELPSLPPQEFTPFPPKADLRGFPQNFSRRLKIRKGKKMCRCPTRAYADTHSQLNILSL